MNRTEWAVVWMATAGMLAWSIWTVAYEYGRIHGIGEGMITGVRHDIEEDIWTNEYNSNVFHYVGGSDFLP